MVEKIRFDSKKPLIMGILNLTPDSFWSGSRLPSDEKQIDMVVDRALEMENAGADLIDIGAESSRPDANPVSYEEERKRLIPVLVELKKKLSIPISVDTYKGKIAREALEQGASFINDIKGLTNDEQMLEVVVEKQAYVVIMHMKGNPKDMQKDVNYKNLLGEIFEFLSRQFQKVAAKGLPEDRIFIDPGIGFGKSKADNIEILKNIGMLKQITRNILIGASRKSFIGFYTNSPVERRLPGSLAAAGCAVENGARIIRVHDVPETVQYLQIRELIS